jgi:hypothetical protein
MKYFNVYNGLIPLSNNEISDEIYDTVLENYNIIETYFRVEQLLYILIANYNELCVELNKITLKNFIEGSIDKDIAIDITNVNWKLLNLSASFKCYLDQIKGSRSFGGDYNPGLFEEIEPALHKKILDKLEDIKENDKDAQYLYDIRNEIQHNNLPMQYVGMSRNIIGKEDDKTRIINMTFNKEFASNDYVRVGNGLQSLFDLHYDIIRKYYFDMFYNAKKDYIEFINQYIEPDENRLMILFDDEKEDSEKQYITRDYLNRVHKLIDKNPERKPKVKGWFPGIINVADIEENKKKLRS